MKEDAINFCVEAVAANSTERDVAIEVKKKFDTKYGSKWHCVVGRHFASHISYEPRHYIHVQVGQEVILLFKSGS
eukprot:CAMPEP_0113849090 /NCGR_PEP_ID=MMETSP0372-20130328/2893_1 /TAXON_ID=340204 /ORGANISM="Lankesteria abbotti" /LENGTH=74 /DNA_ID=CAMNT_0000818753 /DNA_START=185 /DNA_END=409 /DNA_ORIENTATION=+ /assembly_acc=CAM_ASM_000359